MPTVMTCHKLTTELGETFHYPALVQQKIDGIRVNIIKSANKISFVTRGSKELTLPHWRQSFRDVEDGVYDGELVFGNLPRQTSNGLAYRAQFGNLPHEAEMTADFKLWDYLSIPSYESGYDFTNYVDRFNNLRDTKLGHLALPTRIVTSYADVLDVYGEHLAMGNEGIVLKSLRGEWRLHRSKQQLKLKNVSSADLYVYDVVEGTGQFEGALGALQCKTGDGLIKVSVGSGFKANQRFNLWSTREELIGRIVEVKYNARIGNTLYLPIFNGFREKLFASNEGEL
jgi:ATP-dependent DNA ligase